MIEVCCVLVSFHSTSSYQAVFDLGCSNTMAAKTRAKQIVKQKIVIQT